MATTNVDIVVSTKGQTRLERLNKSLANTDSTARKLAQGLGGTVAKLSALTGVAVGLGSAFNTLKQQDFAIAKVKTLGVESEKLVQELKQVSEELKGQASVAELTGAAYDVASAGFTKAADAAKILKAASLGATGGFSDINTVGNATTSVLNAYGLAASNAERLVDQFIQTQNDGKIVVAEYAQNIGKVASAAAGLKVPLSEVNAVIAQSTAAGVQSEVAFTGLKGALARLASGEAAKALKDVGIDISAATIEADGLLGTLKKLEGLDTGTLFKALGTEAGPALLPVIQNLERFEQLIKNQERSGGAALKAQAEAANTLTGALKSVETAFSNLITSGTGINRVLIPAFQGLAKFIEALNGPLGVVIASLGGLAIAWFAAAKAKAAYAAVDIAGNVSKLKAVAVGLSVIGEKAMAAAAGKKALAGAITAANTKMTAATIGAGALKVALLALPWVAVAAGVTALTVAIVKYYQRKQELNKLLNASTTMTNNLTEAQSKLKAAIDGTADELARAEIKLKAMKNAGSKNARAIQVQTRRVRELRAELEGLEREYVAVIRIQTIRDEFGIDPNEGGAGTRGRQATVDRRQAERAASSNALNTNIGDTVGGGVSEQIRKGAKAVEEAVTPLKELAGDIDQQKLQNTIDERLLENQRQITAARAEGNEEIIRELENTRELIPVNEKLMALENLMARMQEKRSLFKGTAEEFEQEMVKVRDIYEGVQTEFDSIREKQEAREAELARAQAKAREDALRPLNDQRELLEAKLNGNEAEVRLMQEARDIAGDLPNLTQEEVFALLQKNQELEESVRLMEAQKEAQKQLASDIAGEFTDALGDVIKQTKTVEEAFSDMFTNIGNMFIDMAMNLLASEITKQLVNVIGGLFNSFPAIPLNGFATGGTIQPNTTALVGERGPELVTTGTSPVRVYNNGDTNRMLDSSTATNAMSTYSPANSGGGSGISSKIDVSYDVTEINSVKYVTEERFREGIAMAADEGAKRGQASALGKMRNSPGTRSRLRI